MIFQYLLPLLGNVTVAVPLNCNSERRHFVLDRPVVERPSLRARQVKLDELQREARIALEQPSPLVNQPAEAVNRSPDGGWLLFAASPSVPWLAALCAVTVSQLNAT